MSTADKQSKTTERHESSEEYDGEFLHRRALEIEETLTRAENYFHDTLMDVFDSFPVRSSASEGGYVPLSLNQLFSETVPSFEITFSRRFENNPRMSCWLILKRKSPPKPALAKDMAHYLRPKDPFILKIDKKCITINEKFATIHLDSETLSIIHALNDVYTETLPPAPVPPSQRKSYRASILGSPRSPILEPEPKKRDATKIMFHWIAWTQPQINREISSAIQTIFASPSAFTKPLQTLMNNCLGPGLGPATQINEGDSMNQTLLHAAASKNNIDLAAYLLKRGANINAIDSQGWTPLLTAISEQNADMALWLLSQKANPLLTCERGYSALHLLCRWEMISQKQPQLIKLLTAAGLDINTRSDMGETPLLYLCRKQFHCIPLLHEFLKYGADTTIPDHDGVYPIHIAIRHNNLPLVEELISNGALEPFLAPERSLFPISVPLSFITAHRSPGSPTQVKSSQQLHIRTQVMPEVKTKSPHHQSSSGELPPVMLAMKLHSPEIVHALTGGDNRSLSNNLWLYILSFLEPRDLAKAARVCHDWQRMAFALFQTPLYWTLRCGMGREQFNQYLHLCKQMHSKNSLGASKMIRDYTVEPMSPNPDTVKTNGPKISILVFGTNGCGKSSFIRRFCTRSFLVEDGIEMNSQAIVKVRDVSAVVDMIEMNPSRRREDFEENCRSADCAIILCDLNKRDLDPVNTVDQFLLDWKNNCAPNRYKNVVIAATKCDSRTSWYFSNAITLMQYGLSGGVPFFISSAIDGYGVDEIIHFVCSRRFSSSFNKTIKTPNPPPSTPVPVPESTLKQFDDESSSGSKSSDDGPNSSPLHMPSSLRTIPVIVPSFGTPTSSSPSSSSSSPFVVSPSPSRSSGDDCSIM